MNETERANARLDITECEASGRGDCARRAAVEAAGAPEDSPAAHGWKPCPFQNCQAELQFMPGPMVRCYAHTDWLTKEQWNSRSHDAELSKLKIALAAVTRELDEMINVVGRALSQCTSNATEGVERSRKAIEVARTFLGDK